MNGLSPATPMLVPADPSEQLGTYDPEAEWELKKLKPKHYEIAALVAQGLKFVDIAKICGVTPVYVGMLTKQPLMQAEIARLCEIAGTRMEALFVKTVEVISDAMTNGSRGEQLKAARLQLEATKRIGRPDPNSGLAPNTVDRLELLAQRLTALQSNVRQGKTYRENGEEVEEAQLSEPARWIDHSSA